MLKQYPQGIYLLVTTSDYSWMEISDIRRENLRKLMNERFEGKQARLADALGKSANYISRCLSLTMPASSRKNIGEDFAREIEAALKLGRYDLDANVSSTSLKTAPHAPIANPEYEHDNVTPAVGPSRFHEYPEISWVQAGIASEAIDLLQVGEYEAMHPSDAWAGPNGYWLKVRGPSMTNNNGISFNEGMLILIAPNADVENGQFCVAKLNDSNEVTFKQFIWDGGRAFLKPLNPGFPTVEVDDTWTVIGKVVDAKWPRTVL